MAAPYVFRSRWPLGSASPKQVYGALEDVESYPTWWKPYVREVRKVDPDGDLYMMCVRSFLPYELRYALRTEIKEPGEGVLQAYVDGDIEGFVRWEVFRRGGKTWALFEERVITHVLLLNLFAPIARLAFEWNHYVMMADGLIALRKRLGVGV